MFGIKDITEENMKQSSENNYSDKVVLSDQNHEEVFNSMLDPVIIYQVDENNNFVKFINANEAFLKIYGYCKSELAELDVSIISAEQDKLKKLIHDIGSKKVSLFETLHKTKSGHIFPVEGHSRFIYLQGKKAIISVIRDITIRKANENKLLAINDSKDNILKVVSHDLRNPLAQIQGVLQILKIESPTESVPQHYLTIIQESLEQAEEIVSELLASGDVESIANLSIAKLEVNSFCEKLIKHYSVFVKSKKQLSLNVALPENKLFISADEKKLTRVFDNIISNATKFSFPETEIDFQVIAKDDHIQFSIRDYGIGIPDELKDMIFDKESMAKRNGTMNEKAIGLGMYITKTIVELHKGHIWFESEKGNGTTFFVTLPLIACNK